MEKPVVGLNDLLQIMSKELHDVRHRDPAHGFAVDRLAQRLRKRARLGTSGLRNQALQSFEAVNLRVRDLVLSMDPFIEHNARVFIHEAFERYNSRRDSELIQIAYDYRNLQDLWKFGPGASFGVKGTHFAEKVGQPMTCTAPAKPLVCRLRNNDVYFRAYDIGNGDDGTTLVDGSRLTTVPKNEITERTIAIEPSGNMALQLALGQYITNVLKSIGLDIQDQQDKNKLLAKRGSIDGSLATIDLTSASDMFSPKLVRRLWPLGLYDTMLRLRSPVTMIEGRSVPLAMLSTMGNGFTFPMMTMTFVALVYAVRLKLGGPSRFIDWADTGVFGDDIIVPTREAGLLIETLGTCGFIVNHDKSYISGPFRESCGGDYYEGRDVTPVYVKDFALTPHKYTALNGIMGWCARQQTLLPDTLHTIVNSVPGGVFFVPEWHGDDAGFRTTQVETNYKYLKVAPKRRKVNNPHFEMVIALGGYSESQGLDCVFTPRPYKTRYVVKKARLPRGFLTGRDPLSRTDRDSTYIESYAFLIR